MATRKYASAVRAEQVERTRERIVDVALELLARAGLAGVTIPKVAAAAGVSIPTVYRHFPTTDDLLRAFLQVLGARIGQTRERLEEGDAASVARVPLENFPRFEQHSATLLPLMDSPAFHRVRIELRGERRAAGVARLRPIAAGLTDDALAIAAGPVYALATPHGWRWLRETWGLDADGAARASSWAIGVLLDAIAQGRGPTKPTKPNKARARAGNKKGRGKR